MRKQKDINAKLVKKMLDVLFCGGGKYLPLCVTDKTRMFFHLLAVGQELTVWAMLHHLGLILCSPKNRLLRIWFQVSFVLLLELEFLSQILFYTD